MNKDTILQFINEVIITNGLENGLDAEKVKENIANYKRYLQENGFADEETLKIVTVIETKAKDNDVLKDYVELYNALDELCK